MSDQPRGDQPHHVRPRTTTIVNAILAAVALIVASCGPVGPTDRPSPSSVPPTASPEPSGTPVNPIAVYRQIEGEVVAIRGLEVTTALEPTILDRATLVANLTALFDEENRPEDIAAGERLLIALGLLAPGTSLRDAYLDLQGGQVIGYYSPDEDALFVVSRSGAIGPTERATYAHEFTHALQDQHFDLASLGTDDTSNGDRALAALSLVEGDAVASQTEWMLGHLTVEELGQLIAEASDPNVIAAFARAPAILRETSLFPYQAGLGLVETLRGGTGFAGVNAAYANPPASTEQVIHPERYLDPDEPTAVDLRIDDLLAAGWTAGKADTLGEFIISVWLREGGVRPADARAAAAGWDGDRVALVDGPTGQSVVILRTVWDASAEADAFVDGVEIALRGYGIDHVIVRGSARTEILLLIGPDPGPAEVAALLDE